MLNQQKSRHYLAQFYGTNNVPVGRPRQCNLVARALYPKAGVKSFASLQVRIVSIHEEGALIQSSMIAFLPDHFYICLGEGEIFLTCAKKDVVQAEMLVSFTTPLDTPFVDALTRVNHPLSTLKRMSGRFPSAIESRILQSRRKQ
jgi:hypothetical protein